MPEMPDLSTIYTRVELLEFQTSSINSQSYDWSHIDSLLHPHSQQKVHRIPTIISSRLSQQQTKGTYNHNTTQPLKRTLTILPTYASVLQSNDLDNKRNNKLTQLSTSKGNTKSQNNLSTCNTIIDLRPGNQYHQGSRVPHNGHLVDPLCLTSRSNHVDTGAH